MRTARSGLTDMLKAVLRNASTSALERRSREVTGDDVAEAIAQWKRGSSTARSSDTALAALPAADDDGDDDHGDDGDDDARNRESRPDADDDADSARKRRARRDGDHE